MAALSAAYGEEVDSLFETSTSNSNTDVVAGHSVQQQQQQQQQKVAGSTKKPKSKRRKTKRKKGSGTNEVQSTASGDTPLNATSPTGAANGIEEVEVDALKPSLAFTDSQRSLTASKKNKGNVNGFDLAHKIATKDSSKVKNRRISARLGSAFNLSKLTRGFGLLGKSSAKSTSKKSDVEASEEVEFAQFRKPSVESLQSAGGFVSAAAASEGGFSAASASGKGVSQKLGRRLSMSASKIKESIATAGSSATKGTKNTSNRLSLSLGKLGKSIASVLSSNPQPNKPSKSQATTPNLNKYEGVGSFNHVATPDALLPHSNLQNHPENDPNDATDANSESEKSETESEQEDIEAVLKPQEPKVLSVAAEGESVKPQEMGKTKGRAVAYSNTIDKLELEAVQAIEAKRKRGRNQYKDGIVPSVLLSIEITPEVLENVSDINQVNKLRKQSSSGNFSKELRESSSRINKNNNHGKSRGKTRRHRRSKNLNPSDGKKPPKSLTTELKNGSPVGLTRKQSLTGPSPYERKKSKSRRVNREEKEKIELPRRESSATVRKAATHTARKKHPRTKQPSKTPNINTINNTIKPINSINGIKSPTLTPKGVEVEKASGFDQALTRSRLNRGKNSKNGPVSRLEGLKKDAEEDKRNTLFRIFEARKNAKALGGPQLGQVGQLQELSSSQSQSQSSKGKTRRRKKKSGLIKVKNVPNESILEPTSMATTLVPAAAKIIKQTQQMGAKDRVSLSSLDI